MRRDFSGEERKRKENNSKERKTMKDINSNK